MASTLKTYTIYYYIVPKCLRVDVIQSYTYVQSKIDFAKKIGIKKKQVLKSILKTKQIL